MGKDHEHTCASDFWYDGFREGWTACGNGGRVGGRDDPGFVAVPDGGLAFAGFGHAAAVVFGQLYFSDAWQSIFRIDNSFVLWGIALVLGLMWRAPVVIALCGAALLHLGFDFLLHHDDGRAHFWPISELDFRQPGQLLGWSHYGNIVGPVEIRRHRCCCAVLWRGLRALGCVC